MLRFFTLLISVLTAICANAEETTDSLNVNLSGYTSFTAFSDKTWYPYTDTLALNVDAGYGNFSISGQVATPYSNPLRRFVVEYSTPLSSRDELNIQIGKFTRILSFYPNIADAPSTSGMAMYPLGLYDRVFISSNTFTTLEGINIIDKFKLGSGVLNFHVDYGKIGRPDNQCSLQAEIIGNHCDNSFSLKGSKDNYDYGILYDSAFLSILLYHNEFRGTNTILNSNDPIAVNIVNSFNKAEYSSNAIGISHSYTNGIYFQSEVVSNHLRVGATNAPLVPAGTSLSYYGILGDCFSEQYCAYTSYSKGVSWENSRATDNVVGVTYLRGSWVTSLEFHHGEGVMWEEAFSPNNHWNSFVLSSTFRF